MSHTTKTKVSSLEKQIEFQVKSVFSSFAILHSDSSLSKEKEIFT